METLPIIHDACPCPHDSSSYLKLTCPHDQDHHDDDHLSSLQVAGLVQALHSGVIYERERPSTYGTGSVTTGS